MREAVVHSLLEGSSAAQHQGHLTLAEQQLLVVIGSLLRGSLLGEKYSMAVLQHQRCLPNTACIKAEDNETGDVCEQ